MMTPDQLLNLIPSNLGTIFIKLSLLLLEFLYAIYAGIVIRQSQRLNAILIQENFTFLVFGLVLLHFALVVVAFILTVLFI